MIAEFALTLPVIAVLVFGVIEFGLAWQDKLTVQTAVRSGVRVGSGEGASATADKNLLLGVGSAANPIGLDNVTWAVVYKSTATDGAVPSACTSPAPHSVTGSCNVYTGAQLAQVVDGSAPASWFGCGAAALDRYWCPTTRQDIQRMGTDQLGLWMEVTHPQTFGFFGPTLTLRDRAVMRLEPRDT